MGMLDTTNESQEVTPFSAGDHKAHIYRRTQRHSVQKAKNKGVDRTASASLLFAVQHKSDFLATRPLGSVHERVDGYLLPFYFFFKTDFHFYRS